jgi:hypothetical protein
MALVNKKDTKAERAKLTTARPPALALQAIGAAARKTAAGDKILKALHELEEQIERGELKRIPTYADILRLAGVDRKTLFADAHVDKLGFADKLLLKAGANLRRPKVSKPKGLTHYQKVSVNAEEAEAVRIRKDAEIVALREELRSARQEISALQAANVTARPSVRRHQRDTRTVGSDAMHV